MLRLQKNQGRIQRVTSLNPKIENFKFHNFDKQIVYTGVIDPAESKYGLIFELSLFLSLSFWLFLSKILNIFSKLVGQIVRQIRP